MVFHIYSPSEINAIQRVNTCSTFYIWHMWNCITLNFVTSNITLSGLFNQESRIYMYIYIYIYIYIVRANCIVRANFVLITRKVGGA